MKFVNKLSVISLIVLMCSFMNVANAGVGACYGYAVSKCDGLKTKYDCDRSFQVKGSSKFCKWYDKDTIISTNIGPATIKAGCGGTGGECYTDRKSCNITADCADDNCIKGVCGSSYSY